MKAQQISKHQAYRSRNERRDGVMVREFGVTEAGLPHN